MTELSLTILDIASNSKAASATLIQISVLVDTARDCMEIIISDNGRGLTQQQIAGVTDPFYTTRTTRRVGMGLPLFKMLCEQCEGSLSITGGTAEHSAGATGVTVVARFKLSSVDRPPLGDMGSTMATLILDSPGVDYILRYAKDGKEYVFSTREIKESLGEAEIDSGLLGYLSGMINENIQNINGETMV